DGVRPGGGGGGGGGGRRGHGRGRRRGGRLGDRHHRYAGRGRIIHRLAHGAGHALAAVVGDAVRTDAAVQRPRGGGERGGEREKHDEGANFHGRDYPEILHQIKTLLYVP